MPVKQFFDFDFWQLLTLLCVLPLVRTSCIWDVDNYDTQFYPHALNSLTAADKEHS